MPMRPPSNFSYASVGRWIVMACTSTRSTSQELKNERVRPDRRPHRANSSGHLCSTDGKAPNLLLCYSSNLVPIAMQRFLSRCASASQIVRSLGSTAKTQPRLQPVFFRLSAMISQYFILLRIGDESSACRQRSALRVIFVGAPEWTGRKLRAARR